MKFEILWKGEIYDCEWITETDFKKLDCVSGTSGFIFDEEGKFCVVAFEDKKNWALPGGHLEDYDKSFEDCFIRETIEEANLELKDVTRLGYVTSIKRGEDENTRDYHLRFVAKVHKINEQTIDPAEGYIPKRKFISPEEFDKYCGWGENGQVQLELALKKLEETVEIVEPSENIFKMSDKMQARIKKILPNSKTKLIGSFAIPICGRKEIDILVEVDNLDEASGILVKNGFKKGSEVKNEIFFSCLEEGFNYDLHVLPHGDSHIRKVYDKVINYFKENEDKRKEFDSFKRSLNGLPAKDYKKRKGEFLEKTVFADWLREKRKGELK